MPSRIKSAARVYVVCSVVCVAVVGLAVMAYRLSREMAGPAAAQAQSPVSLRLRTAMANPSRAASEPIQSVAKAPRVPISPRPTLISRTDPAVLEAFGPPAPVLDTNTADPDADEWAGYEPWTPSRPDLYRTVCVRLCDGAYFPMTFGITRDRFKVDAARCQKGCGSPARLFVSKLSTDAPDDLVDVHGAAYADLPHAYKFRTAYDAACTCRSQPWDEASQERHRKLAAAAQTVQLASAKPVGPPVATQPVQQGAPQEIGMLEPDRPIPVPAQASLPAVPIETGTVASDRRPAETPAIKSAHLQPVEARVVRAKPAAPKRVSIAAVTPPETADADQAEQERPKAAPVVRAERKTVTQPVAKPARVEPPPAKTAKPQPQVAARKSAPVVVKPPQAVGVAKPVARPAPSRAIVARADGVSRAQRSFRATDYWRLSYWEPRN